jgi:hypothetical protein
MKEPTRDDLERIADALWQQPRGGPGVRFPNIHQYSASDYMLSGTIDIEDVEHGFIIDSGPTNGCVVHGWGDPDDVGVYEPPGADEISEGRKS